MSSDGRRTHMHKWRPTWFLLACSACGQAPTIPVEVARHLQSDSDRHDAVVVCPLPDELSEDVVGKTIYTTWNVGDLGAPVALTVGRLFGSVPPGQDRAAAFIRKYGVLEVGWTSSDRDLFECDWAEYTPGISMPGEVQGLDPGVSATVRSSCGEFSAVDDDGFFQMVFAAEGTCELSVTIFDAARSLAATGAAHPVNVSRTQASAAVLHAPALTAMVPINSAPVPLSERAEYEHLLARPR